MVAISELIPDIDEDDELKKPKNDGSHTGAHKEIMHVEVQGNSFGEISSMSAKQIGMFEVSPLDRSMGRE